MAWALGLPSSQIPLFVKPAHVFSHTDLTAAGAGSEALLPLLLRPTAPLPPTCVNGSSGESGLFSYTPSSTGAHVQRCTPAAQFGIQADQPRQLGLLRYLSATRRRRCLASHCRRAACALAQVVSSRQAHQTDQQLAETVQGGRVQALGGTGNSHSAPLPPRRRRETRARCGEA